MLLFGAFFLLYETILAIPSVQYLIVDILNEDLTLTGRTYIYTRMLDLMDTQPWFGYGNGTATFFTTYYIHEKLTNTQNGLLNDYIDWGIIGVICLIILTYSVLRSASSRINPFICLIYTYIVLSSIEITLGLRFLAVLPMCMWANKKIIRTMKNISELSHCYGCSLCAVICPQQIITLCQDKEGSTNLC